LREAQGISREEAGYAIRASESKMSRVELGRTAYKERDVADLLTLYGVVDRQERADLLALARKANKPGWWYRYSSVLPPWFDIYLGLEEAASRMMAYEMRFIPDLLQTGDYARSAISLSHPDASESEIDRHVSLRMERQRLLTSGHRLHIWAVLDEAVIRRPLGRPQMMRAQMEHMIELCKLPTVTIQVAPFAAAATAVAPPFTLLQFTEPELPDVVYLEQLTTASYLDKPGDVDAHLAVFDRLRLDADPVSATTEILRDAFK
jgi:hypothetical protein